MIDLEHTMLEHTIITQQFNETINLINKYVYVIYFLNKKSNSCKFVYKTSVYLIQLRFVSVITVITIHAMDVGY